MKIKYNIRNFGLFTVNSPFSKIAINQLNDYVAKSREIPTPVAKLQRSAFFESSLVKP